jgi:hypothetical protein
MRKLQINNRFAPAVSAERSVSGGKRFAGLHRALLLMVLFAVATSALAAPLTGTYKITSFAESGSDVHFSAQLTLVNPGDAPLSVTSVGVNSLTATGHVQYVRTNVVIEPHSSASTTVSFVVSKKEFELWPGPNQIFFVRRQQADGKSTLESVVLMWTRE